VEVAALDKTILDEAASSWADRPVQAHDNVFRRAHTQGIVIAAL
jgi:hypothetical protein